jgi:hypothetical protein
MPENVMDAVILEGVRHACGGIRARRHAHRRRWWVPVTAAAAMGMLAVGLWWTIDRSSERDETMRGVANGIDPCASFHVCSASVSPVCRRHTRVVRSSLPATTPL